MRDLTGSGAGGIQMGQPATRAEVVVAVAKALNRGPLVGAPDAAFPDVASDHWAYGYIQEAAFGHRYQRQPGGGELWKGAVCGQPGH